MDRVSRYSYINAKLRARIGLLVSSDVIDAMIKAPNLNEAVAVLEAMPQKGARLILKVLKSAGANALYTNRKLDEDSLYVSKLTVDDGPRLKRVWARSHGKRDILLKRMSHITVVVDEKAGK